MAQIGTIRLQTQNSGVVDVPVFDTGDSGSNVYEFVRVQTPSGTGFIPVTAPADAEYPYLRVQSQNNGVVAVHNDSSIVTINDIYEPFDGGDLVIPDPRWEWVDTDAIGSGDGGDNYFFNNNGSGQLVVYPGSGDRVAVERSTSYNSTGDAGFEHDHGAMRADGSFAEYRIHQGTFADPFVRVRFEDDGGSQFGNVRLNGTAATNFDATASLTAYEMRLDFTNEQVTLWKEGVGEVNTEPFEVSASGWNRMEIQNFLSANASGSRGISMDNFSDTDHNY